MNRREFLVRATIGGVTVPLLVRQLGCDGDEGMDPGPGDDADWTSLADGTGHTHSITIPDGDLSGGANRTYTSTSANGHVHSVSLTTADFADLDRGCPVIRSSTSSDGHSHIWEIRYADRVDDIETTSLADATGHSHTVTVAAADINTPPSSRIHGTSSSSGHTHDVTLNQADFQTLQNCGSVSVTSSSAESHTHLFSITPA